MRRSCFRFSLLLGASFRLTRTDLPVSGESVPLSGPFGGNTLLSSDALRPFEDLGVKPVAANV